MHWLTAAVWVVHQHPTPQVRIDADGLPEWTDECAQCGRVAKGDEDAAEHIFYCSQCWDEWRAAGEEDYDPENAATAAPTPGRWHLPCVCVCAVVHASHCTHLPLHCCPTPSMWCCTGRGRRMSAVRIESVASLAGAIQAPAQVTLRRICCPCSSLLLLPHTCADSSNNSLPRCPSATSVARQQWATMTQTASSSARSAGRLGTKTWQTRSTRYVAAAAPCLTAPL